MTTLYHYTCEHGHRGIQSAQPTVLRPGAFGFVWMTDLNVPYREALGLTMNITTCDRTAHRYRVLTVPGAPNRIRRYISSPELIAPARRQLLDTAPGTMPGRWWISVHPVPVVYDPIGAP